MSAKNNPSQALLNWQAATPIGKARLELAGSDLVERFEEISKIGFLSELNGKIKSGTKNLEVMQILQSATDRVGQASKERIAIEAKLNKTFFKKLKAGDIRCYAFETPRSLSCEPVEMTYDDFTHYPDWEKGEFKANGLHLIQLRVWDVSLEECSVPELDKAKIGRPSISSFIAAAFDGLQEKGKIDPNSSAKAHYPLIREWICNHHSPEKIDAKRLSDEGIRRHFSPLFNELKKNRKQ